MGKSKNHSETLKKFGERLQKIRKSRGISQEELGARLDLHRTYIGMLERGERNPTLSRLVEIAKELRVNSSDLLPF